MRRKSSARRSFKSVAVEIIPLQVVSVTPQDFEASDTAHTVNLPTYAAGDLLVLALNASGASSETVTITNWTAITVVTPGSSSSYCQLFFRTMVGDEGATLAITLPIARVAQTMIWRVTGHDAASTPTGVATNVGLGQTTITPGNLISGFGATETLWLQYLGAAAQDTADGLTPVVTGFPAGYTGTGTSTTHNSVTTTGVGQGWCHKISTAASEAAGAWTYNPATGSRACAFSAAVKGA